MLWIRLRNVQRKTRAGWQRCKSRERVSRPQDRPFLADLTAWKPNTKKKLKKQAKRSSYANHSTARRSLVIKVPVRLRWASGVLERTQKPGVGGRRGVQMTLAPSAGTWRSMKVKMRRHGTCPGPNDHPSAPGFFGTRFRAYIPMTQGKRPIDSHKETLCTDLGSENGFTRRPSHSFHPVAQGRSRRSGLNDTFPAESRGAARGRRSESRHT